MSALPSDPLYGPLTLFVNAVGRFLTLNGVNTDPAPEIRGKTGNPIEDIQRGWEDLKKGLAKFHQVLVGVQPEVDEALQQIVAVGAEITALTTDPQIVGPVQDLVQMALDERADFGDLTVQLGEATSFIPVVSFIVGFTPIQAKVKARRQKFVASLTALVAYYGLQLASRN